MATKGKFPANLFKGKESMSEELKEAKAIKSGKTTPMQYAKGEKSEDAKKKGNPFAKGPKRFAMGGAIEEKLAAEASRVGRMRDAAPAPSMPVMGGGKGPGNMRTNFVPMENVLSNSLNHCR